MLSRLFRRVAAGRTFAGPPGRRLYAIGDVHGRLDLLDDLLARIDADATGRAAAETTIVFLGDLVDRGPDSAGVVERLLGFADTNASARFLTGNHEEIFLTALAGDEQATRLFCRVGGRETALSYGIAAEDYEAMSYAEVGDRLRALVPPRHRDFLAGFESLIEIGDYAFVHAGINPGRPLAGQRESDLRWIREPFLDHRGVLEKVIVHGHTISAEVDERAYRIGIDTGGYATGRLTALGLEGESRWTIQTEGLALYPTSGM